MSISAELQDITWSLDQLSEAIEALARYSKLLSSDVEHRIPAGRVTQLSNEALTQWAHTVAQRLNLETEPVTTTYGEIVTFLKNAGPALLRLSRIDEPDQLLLLLPTKRRRSIAVLGPDLQIQSLAPATVQAALCYSLEAPLISDIEHLVAEVQVPADRQNRVYQTILRQRLENRPINVGWLLRLPPSAHLNRQFRQEGWWSHLAIFSGAYAAQYLLFILSWLLIGSGALQGRVEFGWLLGWGFLLMTLIPLRLLASWAQGLLAMSIGGWLKRRLLYGALQLEPDEIRHQGAGQLLGRVIESEAVETLALNGGFLGLVASIEMVIALFILQAGAGGGVHQLLLLIWLLVIGGIGWAYYRRRLRWTSIRLDMTHDLVEQMVGHRTRLAQELPDQRHTSEDQAVAQYINLSTQLDQTTAFLGSVTARGWLILGLIGLIPAFVAGSGSVGLFAVGLGGILLAMQALQKLVQGLVHFVGATIAWQQVVQLYQAASRAKTLGTTLNLSRTSQSDDPPLEMTAPVIAGHDLNFRYRERGIAILQQCNLTIGRQDRILLEGPSGGGKSTLASLLVGLRSPETGLLLLNGLDRQTVGAEAWRHQVVAAPQFHENHVLTETFAFNLLMGRRWPPTRADVEEALTICHELGLTDLIERMPAGLLQMVGETGWQLSHGEKSRLYIARALLQGADLIILDESFAALDPENMRRALRCVLDRAPALLVIAHP